MEDILKTIGVIAVVIAICLGLIFLAALFIKGGVWLSIKILPWLSILMWIVFAFNVVVFLPLGIFKKTKAASGIGIYVSSYIYGLTLWLWGLLVTYMIWGKLAVFIGLFIYGVGVVPMAMIAAAIEGDWMTTGSISLLLLLTFGSRILGLYFIQKADDLS